MAEGKPETKKKPARAAAKAAPKAADAAPKKAAARPKAAKAAAPVAAPEAAARKPAAAAKPARPKPEKALKVTQIGSPIGRQDYQRATLKGLGLNKRHRSRVLEDTPAVRGMIARVQHLVRVESASEGA